MDQRLFETFVKKLEQKAAQAHRDAAKLQEDGGGDSFLVACAIASSLRSVVDAARDAIAEETN